MELVICNLPLYKNNEKNGVFDNYVKTYFNWIFHDNFTRIYDCVFIRLNI